MVMVLIDLLEAKGPHILNIAPSLVPVGNVFKRCLKRPARLPVQALLGFRYFSL
jgi:hypothetical protein